MDLGGFDLAAQTLEAIDAHVAVLDGSGAIVYVNGAWRRFGESNGAATVDWIGRNYVDECLRAAETGDGEAGRVFSALRQLLGGNLMHRRFMYECSSATQRRIFSMSLSGFHADGELYGVVMHHNLTIDHLADDRRLQPA